MVHGSLRILIGCSGPDCLFGAFSAGSSPAPGLAIPPRPWTDTPRASTMRGPSTSMSQTARCSPDELSPHRPARVLLPKAAALLLANRRTPPAGGSRPAFVAARVRGGDVAEEV